MSSTRSSPAFSTVRITGVKTTSRLLLIFLLVASTSSPSEAISFGQWRTLISLTHSLMIRVATIRAERGDISGSERARKIAKNLEGGLGFWGGMWSMSWDFFRNYAWRDMAPGEMFGAISDMTKLLSALNELTRKSDKEKVSWVLQNYENVLLISKSLSRRFLQVFGRSGPLRELMLTLQEEIEGGLVRDCIELGTNDFKGLIQILKDLASQSTTWGAHRRRSSDDL